MATLFTKIIAGDIPSVKIHEDEYCVVILDISPINKGHALVISRNEYETITECPDEELSKLMQVAKIAALKMEEVLDIDGFNIMINNRPASGQEVPHLHIHVIPRFTKDGKTPRLLKESYADEEMLEFGRLLSF